MVTLLPLRSASSSTRQDAQQHSILVVEDEPDLRDLLCMVLAEEHPTLRIVGAGTSQRALEEAAHSRPILMLLDYRLYGSHLNGIELFDMLHADPGAKPIPTTIMISVNPPPEGELQARGIIRMPEPFDLDALLVLVAAELRVIT